MTTNLHEFDFVRDATRSHQDAVANEKINRAWDVQQVSGIQSTLSQRQFAQASAISRKTLYEACTGVCNASLDALAGLLYESIEGVLVNVNADTWRVKIPLPWGKGGHKHYGLRTTEADTLRAVMLARCDSTKAGHIHLLFYEPGVRYWCLNLADYPTVDYARTYLDRWPVKAAVVAKFWHITANRKRGRNLGAR